jgi:hypothetical protein
MVERELPESGIGMEKYWTGQEGPKFNADISFNNGDHENADGNSFALALCSAFCRVKAANSED